MNGWRILKGKIHSSLALFMSCVEECISDWESRKSKEGLNKSAMYKMFGKSVEFKKYLLMQELNLGQECIVLIIELGRHRGREGKSELHVHLQVHGPTHNLHAPMVTL